MTTNVKSLRAGSVSCQGFVTKVRRLELTKPKITLSCKLEVILKFDLKEFYRFWIFTFDLVVLFYVSQFRV